MVLVNACDNHPIEELSQAPFPRDVEFVISALEAGPRPLIDRHKAARTRYRVRAHLRLYSDPPSGPGHLLYTRNVSPAAMAFLSARPVTLSHGGVVRIHSPQGKVLQIACTVLRCREVASGWFEGAVYFNREQAVFAAANMPTEPAPAT